MFQSNEEKLFAAGFTLLRTRDTFPIDSQTPRHDIWHWNSSMRHWSLLEKGLKSKAARERRMKELLENPKNLNW